MARLAEGRACTGCGGCAALCPTGSIVMTENDRGFAHPKVAESGCTDCGKCSRVCPALMEGEGHKAITAYAAAVLDDGLLAKSSSGGVFGALARRTLGQGGLVVGAAFDKAFDVVHQCAENPQQLEPLLCSKYVQSNTVDGIQAMMEAAKKGRLVLFAGTPCQTNAVAAALGKRDNVLTVDIVCHGVPSGAVWRKYLDWLEKGHGGKLKRFNFRDKTHGWQGYRLKAEFEGGATYTAGPGNDPYMRLFLQDVCLRPSCNNCLAKARPLSDLTLGDFWGIKEFAPDFAYQQGASLVLPRTEKGLQAFESIHPALRVAWVTTQGLERVNPALAVSSKAHPKGEAFYQGMEAGESIVSLAGQYTKKPGWMDKAKGMIKRLIR